MLQFEGGGRGQRLYKLHTRWYNSVRLDSRFWREQAKTCPKHSLFDCGRRTLVAVFLVLSALYWNVQHQEIRLPRLPNTLHWCLRTRVSWQWRQTSKRCLVLLRIRICRPSWPKKYLASMNQTPRFCKCYRSKHLRICSFGKQTILHCGSTSASTSRASNRRLHPFQPLYSVKTKYLLDSRLQNGWFVPSTSIIRCRYLPLLQFGCTVSQVAVQ